MSESTELGQDKDKINALVREMYVLFEEYYPSKNQCGLELFEQLDALALFTVFTVYSIPEKMIPTAKRYFSQRLGELSKRIRASDN